MYRFSSPYLDKIWVKHDLGRSYLNLVTPSHGDHAHCDIWIFLGFINEICHKNIFKDGLSHTGCVIKIYKAKKHPICHKASWSKVHQSFCTISSQIWLEQAQVCWQESALQKSRFDQNLKIAEDYIPKIKPPFRNDSDYQHCVKKVVFLCISLVDESNDQHSGKFHLEIDCKFDGNDYCLVEVRDAENHALKGEQKSSLNIAPRLLQ